MKKIICIFLLWISMGSAFAEPSSVTDKDVLWTNRVSTKSGLSLHKDMYILPYTVSNAYKDAQTEVVFQISAKQRVYKDLYFAYTQKSFWQAYDYKNSSPFRETNYNPEIFYRIKPGHLSHENLGTDLGFEHESNGQQAPDSRSYNRLYLAPYYLKDRTLLYSKLWYRLPEDEKPYPGAAEGDDNPDLHHYLGYGELHLYQGFGDKHMVHLMGRGNIKYHYGAFSLDYSVRLSAIKATLVFSFFTGYGESLIDYNRSITRAGIGFAFNG